MFVSGVVAGVAVGGPVTVTASTGGQSGTAQITVTSAITTYSTATLYISMSAATFPDGPFTSEIIAINANTEAQTNLTLNAANDRSPTLSPDGQFLSFVSNRNYPTNSSRQTELLVMRINGSNVTRLPNTCPISGFTQCLVQAGWLANGNIRYWVKNDVGTPTQIGTFTPLSGNPTIFTSQAQLSQYSLIWSEAPLGALSASYNFGIVLQQLPGGQQTKLSPACTFSITCWGSTWSSDSRHLFSHREGVLMEYDVTNGSSRALYTGTKESEEFRLSPDNLSIALLEDGAVKVISVAGGNARTVFAPYKELNVFRYTSWGTLRWSRDSKSIAFIGGTNTPSDLLITNADGSGWKKISNIITDPTGITW